MSERPRNRLAAETSPYLLHHASNPVDWYPWGRDALDRASREDKPILLSIGYAACHWCHVMERESFEDERTAALMNEHFVSVKVDREERPDLDAIYMDAVQAMTGGGGWPLTAFLTPDGHPFYAGTYYPPEPRHGMPAFRDVLTGIAEAWRDRRGELVTQGARVLEAVGRASTLESDDRPLSEETTVEAAARLRDAFDPEWGGFGGAPKFPQPMALEFLLRRAARGDDGALRIVTTTLDRMAEGGIRDHVGGGFARYSTDAAWHVPHFEKMLSDNAQLARLYTRAWLQTRDDRYRRVATETIEHLLRDVRGPEGGFASSIDADADGVEGRFAVWSWEELVSIVGPHVAVALGATPEGNWEGTNVLWRPEPTRAIAERVGVEADRLEEEIDEGLERLRVRREERPHPGVDDKVLAGWNGLAVSALAEAGRAFDRPAYLEAARETAELLWTRLRDAEGRLLRSWRRGVAGGRAYADDHALLAEAGLSIFETTGDVDWFERARSLADELLLRFHDPERGGFYTTAVDAERLVVRPKDLYDHALPSGNSAAAIALARLALLTGEHRYADAAAAAMRLVAPVAARAPTGFGAALCAIDLLVGPSREVAIVGRPEASDTRALVDVVARERYRPNAVLAVGDPADAASTPVPLLRDRPAKDGVATAYVCEGFACRLPVTDPAALRDQLDEALVGQPRR